MLNYPVFNPIALQLGPLKIYWYGIMYVLGFASAWSLAAYRIKKTAKNNKPNPQTLAATTKPLTSFFTIEEISDLIFYCALGVILGGRIGYILFYYLWYNFTGFIANPFVIFKIWEGGMSFHGGTIGVIISIILFAKKHHKNFLDIADFTAPLVPIGLFLGRIGNFINSELLGRVTNIPWAIIYPNGGPLPRHPSQLYEACLEGIALFIFLWLYSATTKPRGKVAAWFLIGYGLARCFCEFFREPDSGIGFVAFNWLTVGQLLSLPMIIAGIWLLTLARRNNLRNNNAR